MAVASPKNTFIIAKSFSKALYPSDLSYSFLFILYVPSIFNDSTYLYISWEQFLVCPILINVIFSYWPQNVVCIVWSVGGVVWCLGSCPPQSCLNKWIILMVLKSGANSSETSESMFSFKMLHSGDRFKFVASQGLENKKIKLKQQNKLFNKISHLNLVLVEATVYLTVLQSDRQCPHWDWSIEMISTRNLLVFQGSQVSIFVSLERGKYHGIHPVTLEARFM